MTWVGRLISIAVILQTVEFFWVTPWKWQIIAPEIPHVLRPLLRCNKTLLSVRLVAAFAALFFQHSLVIFILLITTWGIAVRWRGTFNGGSDAMTFQILLAWLVASCVPEWGRFALFISLHSCCFRILWLALAKASTPNGGGAALYRPF